MAQTTRESCASPTRIPLYDNAKFTLICCVVVGHLLNFCNLRKRRFARAAYVFIYAFHMPLFLFVSGLFVDRERLTRRSACRRAARCFALGMLAKLIRSTGRWLLGGTFRINLFFERGFPWFMFALATYHLLTWLLRRCDYRKVGAVAVLVALVAGYIQPIGNYFCLARIIVFFPFFWLGHALDPRRVAERLAEPKVKDVCLVIVVLFAIMCAVGTRVIYPYRKLFLGRYRYVSVRLPGWKWVHRALAYVMSIAVGTGVLGLIPQRELPRVTCWGRRTLQVYLLHYEVIAVLAEIRVVRLLYRWGYWGWALLIPLGIAIACLLAAPDILGGLGRLTKGKGA